MTKPEALGIASNLIATAYKNGYDGKTYSPPEQWPALASALEYQHAIGRTHAQRGQKSDYETPYGLGRHG